MGKSVDRVEEEALQLSVSERARLVRRLLESLDEGVVKDPAEVDRAWQIEIDRRIAEFRSGVAKPIPASEVFREARAKLRKPY